MGSRRIYVTNRQQPRHRQRSRRPVCTDSRQAQSEQKHSHCLAALGAFLQYRIHGDVGQHEPAFGTTASAGQCHCRTKPRSWPSIRYQQTRQTHAQSPCTTQWVHSRSVSCLPTGPGQHLLHCLNPLRPQDKRTTLQLRYFRRHKHAWVNCDIQEWQS